MLRKYTAALSCDFEYSSPFKLLNHEFYGTLGYEKLTRTVKLIGEEDTHYLSLTSSSLQNWKLLLKYSERKNFMEKLASTYMKENETLTTDKLSLETFYYPNSTTMLSCELGLADSHRANFLKLNANKLYRYIFED